MEPTSENQKKHRGSCHCGSVRFEAVVDGTSGTKCNCTICTKISATGAIVKPETFVLLSDESKLGTYVWGGKHLHPLLLQRVRRPLLRPRAPRRAGRRLRLHQSQLPR